MLEHHIWWALIVFVLPFVVFWPVTFGLKIWATGDFSSYQEPLSVVIGGQWRQGHLPLWNPYFFGGTPLLAAQQGAAFYPLSIPLWLLLPPWAAMGYSNLLHLALSGLGIFLFLRSLKLHPLACTLGSLVVAFGGYSMSHLGHMGLIRLLPWIGFACWGFHAWCVTGRRRHLVTLYLATALIALSGYPQAVVYGLMLIGTFVLFGPAARLRTRAVGLVVMVLGIGAASVQWLTALPLWISDEYVRPGVGMFDVLMGLSFHPAYVATLLFPNARAGTFAEMVGYVGVAPLMLCIMSATQRVNHEGARIRRFFAIWAAVALVLSFGQFVPGLSTAVFEIPVFGSLGVPSRHLQEFTFAMAVVGAFGLDGVINRYRRRTLSRAVLLTVAVLACALGVMAWRTSFTDLSPGLIWPESKVLLGSVIVIALSAGLIAAIRRFNPPVAVIGLLALTLVDLLTFGLPIYSHSLASPDFYTQVPESAEAIRRHNGNRGPFRLVSFEVTGSQDDRDFAKAMLAANHNAAYGLESISGQDGLMLRRVLERFNGDVPPWGFVPLQAVNGDRFRWALNIYGVRYLVVRTADAAQLARFYDLVFQSDQVSVFTNRAALPRLFATTEAPVDSIAPHPLLDSESIQLLPRHAGRIAADVDFAADRHLIHSTSYATGWHATIDGAETTVLPAARFLQTVSVPSGRHHVEMWYEPPGLRWAALIAMLSVVFMTVLPLYVGRTQPVRG